MTIRQRSLRRRIHGIMFKLPLMISCREFEEFIVDYLDDQLPARQKKIFEFHLKICRECRDYLAAYEATRTLARSAIRSESTEALGEVPEDLVSAILDAREHGD